MPKYNVVGGSHYRRELVDGKPKGDLVEFPPGSVFECSAEEAARFKDRLKLRPGQGQPEQEEVVRQPSAPGKSAKPAPVRAEASTTMEGESVFVEDKGFTVTPRAGQDGKDGLFDILDPDGVVINKQEGLEEDEALTQSARLNKSRAKRLAKEREAAGKSAGAGAGAAE